jgi:hypothetical protein
VRTFLAISVSRIHTQLQRLFPAEDAADCYINHPGGLLRHDIQIESVNGNGLKQLKKARSDRDPDGSLRRGVLNKGAGQVKANASRDRSPVDHGSLRHCLSGYSPHPPDPLFPAVSVHTLDSGWLLTQSAASRAVNRRSATRSAD